MLEVIIAEDDRRLVLSLKKYIEGLGCNVVGTTDNGVDLIRLTEELRPNIILVDIDMPKLNGLKAAEEISNINPYVYIIFCTGSPDYAREAYNIYAYDYIVKPFKYERLQRTINRIKDNLESQKSNDIKPTKNLSQKIAVKTAESLTLLNIEEILFVTVNQRKTIIHTTTNQLRINETLSSISKRLPSDTFLRIHKSFVVNLNKLTQIYSTSKHTYEALIAGTNEKVMVSPEAFRKIQNMF